VCSGVDATSHRLANTTKVASTGARHIPQWPVFETIPPPSDNLYPPRRSVNGAATSPKGDEKGSWRVPEPLTPDGGSLEGGVRPAFSAIVSLPTTTAPQMLNIIRCYFGEHSF
jgi:hypothetical protein